MSETRSMTVHYLFRAVLLAGLAFYILYLVKNGSLVYYIAPRMEVYVKLAAVVMFVFALYQGFLTLQSFLGRAAEDSCDCGHMPSGSILGNVWLYGLFLLPLLLGFMLPDKLMASDVVAIKGISLGGSGKPAAAGRPGGEQPTGQAGLASDPAGNDEGSLSGEEANGAGLGLGAETAAGGSSDRAGIAVPASSRTDSDLERLFEGDGFNEPYLALARKLYRQDKITITENGFMELLTAVDLFLDRYVGKQMEMVGFVYREPDMAANQFVVSRLAMMCCSADSSPYGVLVEGAGANALEKDSWVKIVGTIGKTTYRDIEIMKLSATSIKRVEAPATPYVYPYYEDFEDLADPGQ